MNWQPGTPADFQVGAHIEEQIDREQAEFTAWRKPVDVANKVLDALAQPTPAPEAKPTELLDPCRFQRGDVITDGQGRWEVVVADKRGMAKLHNLATGKDEDWNAFNNRRFWKVEAMKVPTPAPSQDAEQTPEKGVDRG